ncbi:MAG: hypothetical protein ACRDBO_18325 [Lachnospiraceae bacterium]
MVGLGVDSEYKEYQNAIFEYTFSKIRAATANPSYGDPLTLEIHVVMVETDLYEIPDEDVNALSAAILN